MNATGSGLAYSTLLGGNGRECDKCAIAVDASGEAYVTGNTGSSNFPTTPGAFQTTFGGGPEDAFVTKLNATGSGLAYSTYLGGSDYDSGSGIAVDVSGAAYVTGRTVSSNFPTTPEAFQAASAGGGYDAFVTKLNPTGSGLVYSTYLGGNTYDGGSDIAVDASEAAYVTGRTDSSNFPTTLEAFQATYGGYGDTFVTKLNATGSRLDYSTYLGGTGTEGLFTDSNDIAVEVSGAAYVTGDTGSSDFPTTPGAFQTILGGGYVDAFVAKLAVGGGPEPTYSISGQVADGSGHPILGVTISGGAGHTATTDSNGNYTLSALAAGSYTITPSKSGYTFSPASRTVSVPPDAMEQDFTGYDKPPIVFVHGWGGFPPWGPCDWSDPSSNFKLVYDDLKAAGYYVAYAYLETSPCYTPPLIENVPRLRQAIALAKTATNQEEVILIAHSMGGVVSRAYIEGPDYDEDVAALFTFGSPHLGVPVDVFVFLANGLSLGEYCRDYQPAACDLSILGMALFNEDHPTRATGVTYHVISGDAPFLSRSAFGMVLDVIIRGPDDALIPTGSGTGLSGTLDRWETDEVHSKGCGSRSYFVRDGGQSLSYVQCLKKVLVDKTSNTCGSISPLQVTAEITPMLAERIPFEYGTLLTGQTATRIISLEGGLTLFAAQWQAGTLAVTLVDPNGKTIDPAYAASHPDVVTYDADATSATYYFPNAIAGVWQLVLQASSDIPAGGSAYTTFAAFDSPLSLTAETDRDWYAPGASATITALLSGSPVSAMVTATILRADGMTDTVSLAPLEAGQYQATYTVPDAPGYAEVRLVATGTTAGGIPFERGLSLAFQISSNIVTLSGVYSDIPQPRSPGSSFYEALTVTAGINAIISGAIGLSADLVDAGGNFVAHSFTIEGVTTGADTLALRFDGDDIYVSQRSGPYTLTNLLLTDRRGAALVVAEAENVYTTAAYDYRSFASANIYLPLILK